MCGIVGIFGREWVTDDLLKMLNAQAHRGPDAEGTYFDPERFAALGHNRLSIIDLSDAGRQPMSAVDGKLHIVLNGEIYNYLELRRELESEFTFRSNSDTEVLLAAYRKWGTACLDRLVGMFSIMIWDEQKKTGFAARDRFGVKQLYIHSKSDGTMLFASEIKSLHAAGVPRLPNEKIWATYLSSGLTDHSNQTFWKGIESLPAGHFLEWNENSARISRWYDIGERSGNAFDERPVEEVAEEYLALMKESVMLRFRSDVPVGISISGGLDSSLLLGLVHEVQGSDSDVKAFTFTTGDDRYDELPWVQRMLAKTNHSLIECRLAAAEVPALAEKVQMHQDEPFGGFPTIAYSNVFKAARANGVTVVLDGNGMDEQWAGYDYYQAALKGSTPGIVQGTTESPFRGECLNPEFRALAESIETPNVFDDKLRNIQYRDARFTKIPRAMRFNDRISMMHSIELREPFLDHRLFELALRQPANRKIDGTETKAMLRKMAKTLVPEGVSGSPKRPVQTPQREWLRNELRDWATDLIDTALDVSGEWFDKDAAKTELNAFLDDRGDNSFYIWQWISIGLMNKSHDLSSRKSSAAVRAGSV